MATMTRWQLYELSDGDIPGEGGGTQWLQLRGSWLWWGALPRLTVWIGLLWNYKPALDYQNYTKIQVATQNIWTMLRSLMVAGGREQTINWTRWDQCVSTGIRFLCWYLLQMFLLIDWDSDVKLKISAERWSQHCQDPHHNIQLQLWKIVTD